MAFLKQEKIKIPQSLMLIARKMCLQTVNSLFTHAIYKLNIYINMHINYIYILKYINKNNKYTI